MHFTGDKIKLALVGNPNSGKSTLFNVLTGLRQKTGNYPGVTVEKKTGSFFIFNSANKKNTRVELTDLPGTYSLFPKSADEQITCNVLLDPSGPDYPDGVMVVADASNLKRSLLLLSQVMDLGFPVLLVLNMVDVAEDLGYRINQKELSENLGGVPVVNINSRTSQGIQQLKEKLFQICPAKFDTEKDYSSIFSNLSQVQNFPHPNSYSEIVSIKNRNHASEKLSAQEQQWADALHKFESQDNINRFRLIQSIWTKAVTVQEPSVKTNFTTKLDNFLTHRFLGPIIFLLVMFLLFQGVFYLADFPMTWIENVFVRLSVFLSEKLPAGRWSNLLIEGVVPGISGVVVFIPQIALLFGFLAVLEDTGYMARVSMIMDRLMRGIGLNGKSVIPLVSGVACAVPAIMGTRTISNTKERLITILVTPLMSCSARIPVFTLLIAVMVPENNTWAYFNERGLWLMGLYLLGFFSAVLVAFVLKFIIRIREKSFFIMELPVYRVPQWRTIFILVFSKVKVFLWDAGRVIFAISIFLWGLKSWGPGEKFSAAENKIKEAEIELVRLTNRERNLTNDIASSFSMQRDSIEKIKSAAAAQKLEYSYIGTMGKWIEPAISPLGFDWKIGISLITSFAAREVFVGTMATIYGSADEEVSLREKLSAQINPNTGKKVFNRTTCISLLLFYVFALQCMSTLAVVRRETKSWKWPAIQFLFMGAMAWTASFLVQTFLS